MNRVLLLLALAAPLSAQTVLVAGDDRINLGMLLHGNPEGMILTVPSASGQSLGAAMQATLDEEPALGLQIGTQELEPQRPIGRELTALRGWTSEKAHWALLGPGRQVYAEGTEVPTPARLAELYHESPLRTRAERLRDFLKLNTDQAEAQAQLVLELRSLGERRTEKLLGAAKDTEKDAGKGEGKPEAGGPQAPPAQLSEADDARIWGEYAEAYERLLGGEAWLDAAPSGYSPLLNAAQLSGFAAHSPRLRDLAARLIGGVESHLRARPSDEGRWKVWLSLREAGASGRPGEVLAGVAPPPGTKHWPPAAALDAFVEDAQDRNDWREAEAVLQAAYDRTQDLLHALDAAAKEDAGARSGGRSVGTLGSYFGYGAWSGETALLAEAKLRLGKLQEADHIFREAFARAPRAEVAREAAALARRCGAEGLAVQWGELAK